LHHRRHEHADEQQPVGEFGGIYILSGTNTLTNNSLSGNTAGSFGGGIYTLFGTITLTNNIIWGNSSGIYTFGGDFTVNYSIVQQASGVYSGTSNANHGLNEL
jgi:hypothetical protein